MAESESDRHGLIESRKRGVRAPRGKIVGADRLRPHRVYATTSVTTPEPTVLPPSRMAKLLPNSRATGLSRTTATAALWPGMTISVPSGRRTSHAEHLLAEVFPNAIGQARGSATIAFPSFHRFQGWS